jgi:hypothetical protein
MASPIYTLAQYTALTSAYAQCVMRVKYGDKEIEYRSLQEMKQIISEMEVSLGLKKQTSKKFIQHTKGLI